MQCFLVLAVLVVVAYGLPAVQQIPTVQQTASSEWNPVSTQFLAAAQPSHFLAVPVSRDLTGGQNQATGTYYQTSNLPVQTIQARDFSTSNVAQMPTTTFNQMPMINQMPTLSQMPMARQVSFVTDNQNTGFSNRNIQVNPENVKVLGRNATITMISQDDGSALLLINSTKSKGSIDSTIHHWKNTTAAEISSPVIKNEAIELTKSTAWTAPKKNVTLTSGFAAIPKVSSDATLVAKPVIAASYYPKVSADTVLVSEPEIAVVPVATHQSFITSSLKDNQLGKKPIIVKPVSDLEISSKKAYVFDFLAPPVTNEGLLKLVSDAVPGQSYPALTDIPLTSFDCATKRFAGYYADTETNCQVFRRCDTEGRKTDYKCPEQTVFNQVTLTCDWWFNVDCPSSPKFEHFANSRLYTDLPLFDTPPKDYVPKWVDLYHAQLHNERKLNDARVSVQRNILV